MKHKLKLGAIMPGGWLKESLEKNMEGCIGHLDQLVPELLVNQEIYGRDRLGKDAELTDLGIFGGIVSHSLIGWTDIAVLHSCWTIESGKKKQLN